MGHAMAGVAPVPPVCASSLDSPWDGDVRVAPGSRTWSDFRAVPSARRVAMFSRAAARSTSGIRVGPGEVPG